MNSSRATLATTGILLSLLHACAEQTVVPTEPSRVAPLTSIPGSSSAVVRSGEEGERYVRSMATEWAAAGDHRLSQFLREQDQLTVRSNVRADARSTATAPSAPSLVIIEDDAAAESGNEFPSPSTAPSAEIFYSSTVPFVNGSSGVILSSVTYFGNIATTEVKYSATASNGSTVVPESKVSNRGLGDNVPCMGSWLECSWTFKLQTVVSLSLGQDCGITFGASANHRAEWTIPAVSRIPGSTWGTTFAANGTTHASNGPCAAPPPTTVASGGGDGSSPPSTGGTTTEPPYYEPAPFVPSGHWECVVYYMGTDYEREFCTWYAHYAVRAAASPAFARLGSDAAPSSSRLAAGLPSVFVIVTDQLPAGATAVIERHTDGPYRNVLLLPASGNRPATLVAALRALAESRARHGETPDRKRQLILQGTVLDQQIPAAAREYAARFTALIAGARRADAGAYGTRQILEIRLADR
jgi:hypothetical protein